MNCATNNKIMRFPLTLLFVGLAGSVWPSHGRKVEMDKSFFYYVGANGTEHNRNPDDSDYLKTNGGHPLLPAAKGFVGTHGTYRFLSVLQQTALLIGEPKHGIWRVQDNGHIREFRRKFNEGLSEGINPNDESLTQDQLNIIKNDYAAYQPGMRSEGYFYPEQQIEDGHQNFVDLTIYHPKYGGKYDDHVPIDLPYIYCTMTYTGYPHAKSTWEYIRKQPNANKIGPLGKRAGLDIKEVFLNVLRLTKFPDARLWVNVGVENSKTNEQIANLDDVKNRGAQTIDFYPVDLTKYDVEFYLTEKPFFNDPYLFIVVVLEHKKEKVFEYMRPDGPYWDKVKAKHPEVVNKVQEPKYEIPMEVVVDRRSEKRKTFPLPLYGHHHPDRAKFNLRGGVCPCRGGDWAHYPCGNAGAGWPNNLQEITPYCDTFLMDIKLWANLDEPDWESSDLGLPPAANNVVDYAVQPGTYGAFTDEYLLSKSLVNRDEIVLANHSIAIEYKLQGNHKSLDYTPVEGIVQNKTSWLTDKCKLCNPMAVLRSHDLPTDTEFFDYAGAVDTEHNRDEYDDNYLRTNSEMPLLPRFDGFAGTHGNYRFLTVIEQTAVFIGEPKSSLWRVQENGFIREYLKDGSNGLKKGVDPNENENGQELQTLYSVNNDYSSFLPDVDCLYRYPDGQPKCAKRSDEGENPEIQTFVDLTIYHKKYGGKYDYHVPIDLPYFYTKISQANYPYMKTVWKFVSKQHRMNQIGPLGKRAGLDIKENFLNVLPMELFEDAGVWMNEKWNNGKNIGIQYNKMDLEDRNTNYEVYLIERPMFNEPHIFVALILDKPEFRHIRKAGHYFEQLEARFPQSKISVNPDDIPGANMVSTPVFDIHQPNRTEFGLSGGVCPQKGGDFARYPEGDFGSGWPTNYQEITPKCNAILLDLKLWTNLAAESWSDPAFSLGNAGFPGETLMKFIVGANVYGVFTDPYLKGKHNPHMMNLTKNGHIAPKEVCKEKQVGKDLERITIPMQFAMKAYPNFFKSVKEIGLLNTTTLDPYCGKQCSPMEKWIIVMSILAPLVLVIGVACFIHRKRSQRKNAES